MQSRTGMSGHDLAPILVMFPFGLLTVAVILDVSRFLGAPVVIGTLAHCTIAAALVGGVVRAAVVRIEARSANQPGAGARAARRLLLDGTVLLVFAVLVLLRTRTPDRTAGPGLLAIELLGLGMAAVGALAFTVPALTRRVPPDPRTVRLSQLLDNHEIGEVIP